MDKNCLETNLDVFEIKHILWRFHKECRREIPLGINPDTPYKFVDDLLLKHAYIILDLLLNVKSKVKKESLNNERGY